MYKGHNWQCAIETAAYWQSMECLLMKRRGLGQVIITPHRILFLITGVPSMSCSTTRQLALLSIVSDCNRTKYSNIMQQKSFPEEYPTVAYVHDEAYKQMLNHVAFSYSSPRWGNPDGCFITAKFTDGSQCVSPSSPPPVPYKAQPLQSLTTSSFH